MRPTTTLAVLLLLVCALAACGDGVGRDDTRVGEAPASRDASPLPAFDLSIELPDAYLGRRALDAPPAQHVVLVSIDTLRADHLGSYGYARDTSPRLDAFADDAVRFAECTSAASHTTPSHMSMLTGLLPPLHGQWNYRRTVSGKIAARKKLPAAIPTLAERLAALGFTSAAFADGGYVTSKSRFDRGFDLFDSRCEPVDAKVDRALAWWDAQPADGARRFLFVHTYEVHAPYLPPPEHDLFTDADYDGPFSAKVAALRGASVADVDDAAGFLPGPGDLAPRDRDYLMGLYDGCIHFADAEMGRLVDGLLAGPEGERTAILVTSDHGEAFGEHGTTGHASVFEEVVHVPFVLSVPGLAPGVVAAPISGVDTTPTLLDVLGLPSPGPLEGRSALREPVERSLFTYHAEPDMPTSKQAWRRGAFKVHRRQKSDDWPLFDVLVDRGQRAPIEGRDEVVRFARDEMLALEQRHATLFDELWEGQSRETSLPSADELDALRALGYLGDDDGQ